MNYENGISKRYDSGCINYLMVDNIDDNINYDSLIPFEDDKYDILSVDCCIFEEWFPDISNGFPTIHGLYRTTEKGLLSYSGSTIIPLESLPIFKSIVVNKSKSDVTLLIDFINKAIKQHKIIIHYGI